MKFKYLSPLFYCFLGLAYLSMGKVWATYREPDMIKKVVFFGESKVGKSAILSALQGKPFNETYNATIGVDLESVVYPTENQKVKLQVWDISGDERFTVLVRTYFCDADLLVFCYAKNNKASFEAFKTRWQPIIQQACAHRKPALLLCGTKSDLTEEVVVSEEEVEQLQEELTKKEEQKELEEPAEEGWFETVDRLEVSAKTGQGIKNLELPNKMVALVLKSDVPIYKPRKPSDAKGPIIDLPKRPKPSSGSGPNPYVVIGGFLFLSGLVAAYVAYQRRLPKQKRKPSVRPKRPKARS